MKDTKEFILKTAYNLFLCSNYEAVTFSELSKSTGLTKGAIYHHFSSKEELFKAVVDKYLIENRIDFDSTHKSLNELIQYTVKKVKQQILNTITANPDSTNTIPLKFVSLSIEAFRHYPGYAEIGHKHFQNEIGKWNKVLQEAIKSGEIRANVDTEIMSSNFMALGTGIVSNIMLNGSVDYAIEMYEKQITELYKAIRI